jgi:hypothetical protein
MSDNLSNYVIIILPFISVLFLFFITSENINVTQIKTIIPKIINLAQQIEHIKLNLKIFIDKINIYSDIDEFGADILADTSITYNQYVLLKYIENLEELHEDWEMLSNNNLLNNNLIKSPFIIAYHIREILKTSIYNDEDGNPMIWLNKNEKSCLKKSRHFYMYENNKSKETFKKMMFTNNNNEEGENDFDDDLKKNLFGNNENLQTTF